MQILIKNQNPQLINPKYQILNKTKRYRCNQLRAINDNSAEETQLKYKRVRCKVCGGTGWDKINTLIGQRCEKCVGTGWRLFPEGTIEICPSCLGRGRESRFVCQECDGFGEIKLLI